MTEIGKQVGVTVQLYVGYHYTFYVFKRICWGSEIPELRAMNQGLIFLLCHI